VHVRVVVARERAPASFCDRSHGWGGDTAGEEGSDVELLAGLLATKARKQSPRAGMEDLAAKKCLSNQQRHCLIGMQGPRYRADWRCEATTGGGVPERSATKTPAVVRSWAGSGASEEQRIAVAPGNALGSWPAATWWMYLRRVWHLHSTSHTWAPAVWGVDGLHVTLCYAMLCNAMRCAALLCYTRYAALRDAMLRNGRGREDARRVGVGGSGSSVRAKGAAEMEEGVCRKSLI
jgi:hypothetical protein